jgi:hypothetical protein
MSLWWWSLRTETCKGVKNWSSKNFNSRTGRSYFIFYNSTCDIRIWGKHSFLDISFTNPDTLVSSLYQCVKTRNTEVSWLLSQRFNLFIMSETFVTKVTFSWPSCEPPYTTNSPHLKQETVLYKHFLHWSLSPTKTRNRTLFFGSILLSKVAILTTESNLWTCACAAVS